jgi:hypothetical protein
VDSITALCNIDQYDVYHKDQGKSSFSQVQTVDRSLVFCLNERTIQKAMKFAGTAFLRYKRERADNFYFSISGVDVFYPSEYLKGGVRIIDTPGVGCVYRHNTDVAYSYLPYVDAGIFIISADPPLSESEHQFLKDIRGYVDKLFLRWTRSIR